MTDCVCSGPGYCQKHNVNKTQRWFELCQTNQSYFEAWEQGRGPGQGLANAHSQRQKSDQLESLAKLGSLRLAHAAKVERRMICQACPHLHVSGCELIDGGSVAPYMKNLHSFGGKCPTNRWVVQWKDYTEPIHYTRPRVVVTLATGASFLKILEVTSPNLRAYAERCDADYVELTNMTQVWWGLEKFRVHQYAQYYERCLFVDSDMIIHESAPDIFSQVPPAYAAMHNDWQYGRWHKWNHIEKEQLCRMQCVPYKRIDKMLNTGFVLCDQYTAGIWKPPARPFYPTHCSEQNWVDIQASEYPLFELPLEWNNQYWMRDFAQQKKYCYVTHLANHPAASKVSELVRLRDQWAKKPLSYA